MSQQCLPHHFIDGVPDKMLHIVTGHFYPVLQDAIVRDIQSLKVADRLAPLAVIVPSSSLVEYLKGIITPQAPQASLNVYFLTFNQLATRLRKESTGDRSEGMLATLDEVDDFFFPQLLRQVVRQNVSGLELFRSLPDTPRTWQALWGTIRDLKDAAVDPATILSATTEGVFDPEDQGWLQALFTLYDVMVTESRALGVASQDDVTATLSRDLSRSPYLTALHHVFYYGFYDLSQIQLTFFESVIRAVPTTLYFPLEPRQAFHYARQFFERHLLPLATHHEDCATGPSSSSVRERVQVTVLNVVGADEELAAVCRNILTLVEVHQYRFADIIVVARTLTPYQTSLQRVFDHHRVPFTSSARHSVAQEPFVKTLLQLATLSLHDFERVSMLDVLTSPFYRTDLNDQPHTVPLHTWRAVVATLGIVKGEGDWERLRIAAAQEPLIDGDGFALDGIGELSHPRRADDLTGLSNLVSHLILDCQALPATGSIRTLTTAFQVLMTTHLRLPTLGVPPGTTRSEAMYCSHLGALLDAVFVKLAQLYCLTSCLTWREWVGLFTHALDTPIDLPVTDAHQGVQVLEAEKARGHTARAFFLLGLNEKTFPRSIQEDPFLRDRHRMVLGSTLGFKVDEKLAGHEEELLLFELLSGAATQRLYLSYQRVDDAGRAIMPSGLLALVSNDNRFVVTEEAAIPRRLTQRMATSPLLHTLIPAEDFLLGCVLSGHDVGAVFKAMGRDSLLFTQGLRALKILDRDSWDLGEHDGILGSTVRPAGTVSVSPTALESYACCPFQYYATTVLKLVPVQRLGLNHLAVLTRGTLLHESLHTCYEHLVATGWPEQPLPLSKVTTIIQIAVTRTFAAHAARQGIGHALLWTLAQEEVSALVAATVSADFDDYVQTGYRPLAFETRAHGLLPLGTDGAPDPLPIHGTVDRIDYCPTSQALRIVDYKFKSTANRSEDDRNLPLAAIRGIRLQPPFYAFLTVPSRPLPSEVQFLLVAPRWKQPISRTTFDAGLWAGPIGDKIRVTLLQLIHGIRDGNFFILPGSTHCEYCEFAPACRRRDALAEWRSYRAPAARALRQLRKQKVPDVRPPRPPKKATRD